MGWVSVLRRGLCANRRVGFVRYSFPFLLAICVGLAAILPAAHAQTLATEFVADGFTDPLFVTHAPGDATRLFVVEQGGLIKIIKNGSVLGTPFLNLSGIVQTGGERGLLGLAFHPDYDNNGYFYVNYIDQSTYPGDTIIARYSVSGDPDIANAGSGFPLLTIDQYDTNHNGGWMGLSPNEG